MKYRKKPVVIEAFQYDGDLIGIDGKYYVPSWAVEAHKSKILFFDYKENGQGTLYVKTLEGDMKASVGDYIIQGVQGELYPCKSDIFEQTYEALEDEMSML